MIKTDVSKARWQDDSLTSIVGALTSLSDLVDKGTERSVALRAERCRLAKGDFGETLHMHDPTIK